MHLDVVVDCLFSESIVKQVGGKVSIYIYIYIYTHTLKIKLKSIILRTPQKFSTILQYIPKLVNYFIHG